MLPDAESLRILPSDWPALHTAALFGGLLLAGTLGGLLAKRLRWLPTITGFMGVGLLIGPHGLGLLTSQMLQQTQVLVDVALGLILFKLGTALHPRMLWRGPQLLAAGLSESLLTFGAVFGLMQVLGVSPIASALAAAIAVSSSPAVLIHVAGEMHASGTVVNTAKTLVAFNNVMAFLLFSVALAFALRREDVGWLVALGLPAYQLLGAVALGALAALLVTRIGSITQKDDAHYRFSLIVGAVMLVLGLAVMLRVSPLFAALSLGIACRGLQRRARLAHTDMGSGADLFFIILFVYAGANLHVADVVNYWPMALAYAAVRVLAKCVAVLLSGWAFGYAGRQSLAVSLTLLPMAGMAIGLVHTTSILMPGASAQVSAIVLAAVAVFETLGPPVVAYGLRLGGSVRSGVDADPPADTAMAPPDTRS